MGTDHLAYVKSWDDRPKDLGRVSRKLGTHVPRQADVICGIVVKV